ncbi:glutamate receptor, partial [Tropilaelaps mercedesae]
TAEALLYDAVSLVAAGVEALLEKDKEAAKDNKASKTKDKVFRAGPLALAQLDCNRSVHWEHGKALLEAIKGARIRGLSGDLRLNRRTGTRDEFGLDVVELKYTGLKKTASWSPRDGLKLNAANRTEQDADLSRTLEGMTLRVVSVLNEPYTMLYPASENRTGNDRFYGYAIDLIAALADLCKFNYTFYISPDRKYGSRQPDGKWNGMVGELIRR